MKNLTVCLFLLLSGLQNLYCQKTGLDMANEINNSILHTISTEPGIDGNLSICFDSEKRIRKFWSCFEYPESRIVRIGYYDEQGQLVYILFNEVQPEGFSYQGYAYKKGLESDWECVYFNYKLQESYPPSIILSETQGETNTFPETIGDWPLSHYICTDSLQETLDILNLQKSVSTNQVSFRSPIQNDMTFINVNNLWIREAPSHTAEPIKMLDAGAKVKILDIMPEKDITNDVTYHWYKMEYYNIQGYVSGIYLETVEVILE